MKNLALIANLSTLLLVSCSGGNGGDVVNPNPTSVSPALALPLPPPPPPLVPPPSPSSAAGTFGFAKAQAMSEALTLWRNSDLKLHPKGSCSGCHGADFLDLAVIGSTETDILRRAKIDGATEQQAQALAAAIVYLRQDAGLPARNARTFKPFQPGGAVLLPDLSDASHIQAIKRDIAFGQQLQQLQPVLSGPRISSPEMARRARDQMLDLARGTNVGGANPTLMNLRQMPTGVAYPLWSADLHQGAEEGTLNDWIADIARDAPADKRAGWLATQDAYLANPNRTTFWQMYRSGLDMTTPQLLGTCTYDGRNPQLACEAASEFNKDKFFTALIGQHMMRVQAGLASPDFFDGPLPFAYLDKAPELSFMRSRKDNQLLPNNMWEVGDQARTMLDDSSQIGSFKDVLRKLGFPLFARDSINANRTSAVEQQALRLAWFWIGFTFDPSFNRIHKSTATKTAEYMVASLIDENMFLHNAFQANMRLVAEGFLPEANVKSLNGPARIEAVAPSFEMNYSYFIAYGRTVLRWKENSRLGTVLPAGIKDEQAKLWHSFTANGFRMSLYLYLDAIKAGASPSLQTLDPIKAHFDFYQPENQVADTALLNAVREASGDSGRY